MRSKENIRLTIRMPEELDDVIRVMARDRGVSLNQFVLSVIGSWLVSHHFPAHNP